jgi:hypothetical protein
MGLREIGALVILFLAGVPLLVWPVLSRPFGGIFQDLGGEAALSWWTRLSLSLWFGPLVAAGVASATAYGAFRASPKQRPWVMMASAGVAVLALLFCVGGLYYPLFALSGSIRAE